MENSYPDQDQIKRRRMGNRFPGFVLLLIGGVLLLRQLGVEFPWWMFKWYTLLIALGLVIGIKHKFRDIGWFMIALIGVVFMIQEMYPEIPMKQYVWPGIFIALGILIIFRPGRTCDRREAFKKKEWRTETDYPPSIENNDMLDIVSIFGSVKKVILSKNFHGGEIVSIFGGAEINLSQADMVNLAELEIVQIFGGTKLIIPSNWNVRSEAVAILGGVEDKREARSGQNPEKTLIIKGTTIFGGIDIVSYA